MILIIFSFNVATPQILRSEEICFKESQSGRLMFEIEKCDLIKEKAQILEEKAINLELKLNNSELNKEIFEKQATEYKEEYLNVSKELKKEIDAKPNKFNWFIAGLITGAVSVLSMLLASK